MKKYIESFLLMLQFMTRIPINKNLPCEGEDFRRGAALLPLVGLVIGSFQWIIYYILDYRLPIEVVSVFVVLSGVLLTGALHLDGLGDTCDGFFAFKGKDRIIEIMKDSRIGTYACIALIFDIFIKSTSLFSISNEKASVIIIVVPVISRAALITLAFLGKAAKKTGSGNLFIDNAGKKEALIAIFTAFVISCGLIGIEKTLVLVPASLGFTYLFNKFCESKIGGITGDNLGANNELVEMLVLVVFVAII